MQVQHCRLRVGGSCSSGSFQLVHAPPLLTLRHGRNVPRSPCLRSSAAGDESSSSGSSRPAQGDSPNRQQPMGFVGTPVGDQHMARPTWPAVPGFGMPWHVGGAGNMPSSSAKPGTGSDTAHGQHVLSTPSSSGRGAQSDPSEGSDVTPPIGVPASSSYSHFYKSQNTAIGVGVGTQTDESPASSPHGQDETEPSEGHGGTNGSGSSSSPGASSQTGSSATNGGGGNVADALARAQQALNKAESSLDDIEKLPSATPPKPLPTPLLIARNGVILAGLAMALVASHAFGLAVQMCSALAGALGIAWWGYTRRSLDKSGALAALLVGTGTLGCSLRFGVALLAFFFSSSKLTQYKEELKAGLDASCKKGGQRDWRQVFCNGAVPTTLAIAYGICSGCVDVPLGPSNHLEPWRAKLTTAICGAFLGYYACCCGDTWASELGPLSADTPRLITTLRPVRRGTNGGVTLLGLSASVAGGALMGAVFYAAALVSPTLCIFDGQHAAALTQWRLIPLGLMAGLLGSVLDSLLGATLQYSGYHQASGKVTSKPGPGVVHISGLPFLDNNMVNMLSASLTAAITALAAVRMFSV